MTTARVPNLLRDDQHIIINFGDDENVTSVAWAETMHSMLDEIEQDDSPGCLITTGGGKHYSNGLDTTHMASIDPSEAEAYVRRVTEVVYRIMLLGRPTVAAVNGHAFGMGAFVLMAHDFVVMREDRGYVCFPEVHLGMHFPRFLMAVAEAALPPRTLRQALATGARYSGPDSVAVALVDKATPLAELMAEAVALGGPHAGTAGKALGTIKRQLFPEIAALLAET